MAERKYYVLCGQNCKFESMTKEQILASIAQAVETGEVKPVDTGFIETVKTINGRALRFFVGSQSEYESLSASEKQNLFAIITNDTTKEALLKAIEELQKQANENAEMIATTREELTDGTLTVKNAENAVRASADSTGNEISTTYAKLSTDYTSKTSDGATKYEFGVGTILVYKSKRVFGVGDLVSHRLEKIVMGNDTPFYAVAYEEGNTVLGDNYNEYREVIGEWRICGQCHYSADGSSFIIQRIE